MENVIVDSSYVAKICDLGMIARHKSMAPRAGTEPYMAPEIVRAPVGFIDSL